MKRLSLLIIIAVLLMTMEFSSVALHAQEKVEMEEARIYGGDSLISSFLLVCDSENIKYSLVGSSPKGLSSLEITVLDKIIDHKECRKKTDCSISGEVVVSAIQSQVITAMVLDSQGMEHSEKMKITPVSDGTRVYYVGSVPGIGGEAPVILASSGNTDDDGSEPVVVEGVVTTPENSGEKKSEIVVKTPGPELSIDVSRTEDNDYFIQVTAVDPVGVDFIEILENGSFLDVEICESKTECLLKKRLKDKNPGRNKYLLKSMNVAGAISFQEQLLYFTEQ